MLLPFTEGLTRTTKFDAECAIFSDGHYSRRERGKVGSPQFMPPGRTIVLRNSEGTVLFGWLWQNERDDGQRGFNCSIFRNESPRQSSRIILEAEQLAISTWGQNRMFTYIDPSKLTTRKKHGREYCPWPPGRCFLEAGWKPVVKKDGTLRRSTRGLPILAKLRACEETA